MKGIKITPLIKKLIGLATEAAKESNRISKWFDWDSGKIVRVSAYPSGEVEIRRSKRVYRFEGNVFVDGVKISE